MKYTDQPYYPHDTAIAELFVDIIPIIKLSSISKNFLNIMKKKHFHQSSSSYVFR
jgi:hypothetical protein